MDFEWDGRKAASNIQDHLISFDEATAIFADPDILVLNTTRPKDGEDRSKAIGMIQGRLFTIVYTMRGETYRLISARRSNTKEENAYGNR